MMFELAEMQQIVEELPQGIKDKFNVEKTLFEEAMDGIELPLELKISLICIVLAENFSGVINEGMEVE